MFEEGTFAVLPFAGVDFTGLGFAGLGFTALDWAALDWAGLVFVRLLAAVLGSTFADTTWSSKRAEYSKTLPGPENATTW